VANGGFQIPVEFQTSVAAQGQSLQQFFNQVEQEGIEAVNKIAAAAKQPIKQSVEFEVKDDKLQASLRESYAWTDKIEKAQAQASQKEAQRKAKEVADIKKVAAEKARLASTEEKARARRGVAAREATKFRQKQMRELNAIIAKHKAVGQAAATAGLKGKKAGGSIRDSLFSANIAAQALQQGLGIAVRAIDAMVERTKQIQGLEVAFKAFGLTTEDAGKALAFTKGVAVTYGADLEALDKAMRRITPTIVTMGGTLNDSMIITEAIAKRTASLGLNAEQTGRFMEAFAQVMGKGKLQAEELNQQFAELDGSLRGQVAAYLQAEYNIADFNQAMSDGEIKAGMFAEALVMASAEMRALAEIDFTNWVTQLSEGTITIQQMDNAIKALELDTLEGLKQTFEGSMEAVMGLRLAWDGFVNSVVGQGVLGILDGGFRLIVQGINAILLLFIALETAWNDFMAEMRKDLPWVASAIEAIGKLGKWFAKSFNEGEEATQELIAQYSNLNGRIDEMKEKAKLSGLELSQAFKDGTANADGTIRSVEELDKALSEMSRKSEAAMKGNLDVANARLKAEKQIIGVQLEQAKAELKNAKSGGEREKAAKRIYDLTLAQAKLDYEMANAAINASVQKKKLAVEEFRLKKQSVIQARALAAAKGLEVSGYDKAIEAANESLEISKDLLGVTREVAKQQQRGADAVYKGAEAAAQAAYEQNKVAKATGSAAKSSGTFAKNMEKGAKSAEKAAAAAKQAAAASSSGGGGGSSIQVSEEAYQRAKSDPKWGSGSIYRQGAVAMELLSKYNKIVAEENMAKQRRQKAEEKTAERIAGLEKQKEAEIQETIARAEQSATTVTQINENGAYETVKILTEGTKTGMNQAIDAIERRYAQQFASVRAEGARNLALAGARAEGGPVSRGSTYQVNELGREGFLSASGHMSELKVPAWGSWTAPSSGEVIPAHVWAEIKAAGAMGNSSAPAGLAGASRGGSGGSSSVDNSRITNHVTIQSQTPVQTASELMVASAKRRRRRFR
jgi:tape measure domain-containing protein